MNLRACPCLPKPAQWRFHRQPGSNLHNPRTLHRHPGPLADAGESVVSSQALGEALDLALNYRVPASSLTLSAGIEYTFTPLLASASLSLAAASAGPLSGDDVRAIFTSLLEHFVERYSPPSQDT